MVFFVLSLELAQAREFTDAKGRVIEAKLISATGDGKVEIEREGKRFVVPIAMFSIDDQTYIKNWLEKNPGAISYRFRVYADVDDLTNQNRSKDGSMVSDRLKIRPKEMLVDITNLNASSLANIRIEVDAVVEDAVDAISGSYAKLAVGYSKKDVVKTQLIRASATFEAIAPQGRAEIEFEFDTESYVDRDGSKVDGAAQDRVLGVWVKIYQGDVKIGEEKSSLHSNFSNVDFEKERKPTPARNVRSKTKALPK
ncbi:MAG: hypothetical protein AAF585_29680 [Verrucomicrobiota bacterium]